MRILINFIKSNFLSGLAILIPFIITIYLVVEIGTWLNSFVDFTPARFVKLPINLKMNDSFCRRGTTSTSRTS